VTRTPLYRVCQKRASAAASGPRPITENNNDGMTYYTREQYYILLLLLLFVRYECIRDLFEDGRPQIEGCFFIRSHARACNARFEQEKKRRGSERVRRRAQSVRYLRHRNALVKMRPKVGGREDKTRLRALQTSPRNVCTVV